MWFHREKKPETPPYDPARQQPAVRKSICTGEMTGGLLDRETGRFHELRLLRTEQDRQAFCKEMGVSPETLKTIY